MLAVAAAVADTRTVKTSGEFFLGLISPAAKTYCCWFCGSYLPEPESTERLVLEDEAEA